MPGRNDSKRQIRVFPGDQGLVVATHLLEDTRADHHVTAEAGRVSDWRVPFEIGEPVVHAGLWLPLAPATGDNGNLGVAVQADAGRCQPARLDLAVAIDELHAIETGLQLAEPGKARVATPGCGEGARRVQLDDFDPEIGFVPRTDIRRLRARLRYRPRPDTPWVRRYSTGV